MLRELYANQIDLIEMIDFFLLINITNRSNSFLIHTCLFLFIFTSISMHALNICVLEIN